MPDTHSPDTLHQAFIVGLVLKGLDGVLEIIGGIALLVVSQTQVNHLARVLTQHELSEDPHDFIANHILHSAGALTHGATLFGALYLLSHGVIKLVLIVAVIKDKLWAYPWMIALIVVFMVYQIYRIALNGSVGLTMLTIFDGVIVWLTWHEYRQQQRIQRSEV